MNLSLGPTLRLIRGEGEISFEGVRLFLEHVLLKKNSASLALDFTSEGLWAKPWAGVANSSFPFLPEPLENVTRAA